MAATTLDDVLVMLRRHVPSDLALGPICTRVMLRTGVNLRQPRAEQMGDSTLVGKVLAALSDMGYRL